MDVFSQITFLNNFFFLIRIDNVLFYRKNIFEREEKYFFSQKNLNKLIFRQKLKMLTTLPKFLFSGFFCCVHI
jgi:hypothetical protein